MSVAWHGDSYLEPVCLHGVISKAVSRKANHSKKQMNVCARMADAHTQWQA